ncbi:MAG: thiamine phosphate synthase [Desulfuromonadaceae bacterium]|nr:thiamine phosphate synthase [Desulfuromonadaceae bacterium]
MQTTDFNLYLITDRFQTCGRPLEQVVRQALCGGVKAVQLREKDLSTLELYRLAVEMRRLTADYGARLIINDRMDIAQAVGADGVQIGVNSLPVAVVRSMRRQGKVILYSAHSVDEAECAEADGADIVTFGPVYHTPSKAGYGAPSGVIKLSDAVRALNIPVIALGGINQRNVSDALSAGCQGIAVISAILSAADPRDAAASLLKKIEERAS